MSLKWDETMLAEPLRFSGSPHLRLVLLLEDQGTGAAVLNPRSRPGSHVCPQVTPSRPSGHHSPMPENMLTFHEHPRGRPKT